MEKGGTSQTCTAHRDVGLVHREFFAMKITSAMDFIQQNILTPRVGDSIITLLSAGYVLDWDFQVQVFLLLYVRHDLV